MRPAGTSRSSEKATGVPRSACCRGASPSRAEKLGRSRTRFCSVTAYVTRSASRRGGVELVVDRERRLLGRDRRADVGLERARVGVVAVQQDRVAHGDQAAVGGVHRAHDVADLAAERAPAHAVLDGDGDGVAARRDRERLDGAVRRGRGLRRGVVGPADGALEGPAHDEAALRAVLAERVHVDGHGVGRLEARRPRDEAQVLDRHRRVDVQLRRAGRVGPRRDQVEVELGRVGGLCVRRAAQRHERRAAGREAGAWPVPGRGGSGEGCSERA